MKRVCQRSREVLKCEIRRDKREKETLEVVPLMGLIVLCLVCVHLQYHVSFEKTTKKTNLLFRFEENSSRDVLVVTEGPGESFSILNSWCTLLQQAFFI